MRNMMILADVYTNENGRIYNEIIENEFIEAYLIVEYSVCNAGVITNSYFANDLPEEMADQSIIFDVEELANIEGLKNIIENSIVEVA